MKHKFVGTIALAIILIVVQITRAQPGEAPHKPNVLFILVDDMGYGDVGVFWQNERGVSRL